MKKNSLTTKAKQLLAKAAAGPHKISAEARWRIQAAQKAREQLPKPKPEQFEFPFNLDQKGPR